MKDAPTCIKCGAQMDAGFMKDATLQSPTGRQAGVVPQWIRGTPDLKLGLYGKLVSYDKAEKLAIVTYCCSKCGFLESYAVAVES
ncbi:MAG: hypothetical protein RIC55_26480 [Pirellulaceae bacterium]